MIYIKSLEQIEKIRAAGKLSAHIMENALKMVDEGLTPKEIDAFINEEIIKRGAFPWFKEKNGYPFASCISVNQVWVHGMPTDIPLKYGDIVSIDIGVKLKDSYSDHCWTIPVVPENERPSNIFGDFDKANISEENKSFLRFGKKALDAAIAQFKDNGRSGDMSHAMQSIAESAGYSVIREFTGHGVGIKPHEDPELACYGTKGAGIKLKKGMVLAVEIMYCMGKPAIITKDDGWSVSTKDLSLSGMFEHTVALTENGSEILTI